VNVAETGLVLKFVSDPLPDSRFSGTLRFPWAKGTQHTPEEMASQVAEVIGVEPPQDQNEGRAPAGASSGQQGPPPILPPAPPTDQPPAAAPSTVGLGQSKAQVVAALGQPTRVVNSGGKQILYFQGLTVTLVNDKVTDVQ
jgi:hypothetical protein